MRRAAYFLATASTISPTLGLRLDDLKWGISVLASLAGTVVALYIFERSQKT